MNALVIDPSGTDRPRWSPVARAEAQAGDVLVRITAVGLAWGDVLQAQGKYSGGPSGPFVPGHEFVGEVVGFGDCRPSVDYAIGDRIFGLLPRGGALAELVAAPATWFDRVPAHLTDAEAAAVPSSFFTADAALFTMGRLDAGEVVVVQAAAGGFGSAAVQLARGHGAARSSVPRVRRAVATSPAASGRPPAPAMTTSARWSRRSPTVAAPTSPSNPSGARRSTRAWPASARSVASSPSEHRRAPLRTASAWPSSGSGRCRSWDST